MAFYLSLSIPFDEDDEDMEDNDDDLNFMHNNGMCVPTSLSKWIDRDGKINSRVRAIHYIGHMSESFRFIPPSSEQ